MIQKFIYLEIDQARDYQNSGLTDHSHSFVETQLRKRMKLNARKFAEFFFENDKRNNQIISYLSCQGQEKKDEE